MKNKPEPMYRNPDEEPIAPDRLWGRFWLCVTLMAGLAGLFLGTWTGPLSALGGAPWWMIMGGFIFTGLTGLCALAWGLNGYCPRETASRWTVNAALVGAAGVALGFVFDDVFDFHAYAFRAVRIAGVLAAAYAFFWAYHAWRQVVQAGRWNEPTLHPATKSESEQHGTNILLAALCACLIAAGLFDAVLIGHVAKFGPLWFVVAGIYILQPQLFIWTRIPEGEIERWRVSAGALGAASALTPAGVLASTMIETGIAAGACGALAIASFAATRHLGRSLRTEARGIRLGLSVQSGAGIALAAGAALIRLTAPDGLWEPLLAALFGVTSLAGLGGTLLAANTRLTLLGWPETESEEDDARPGC